MRFELPWCWWIVPPMLAYVIWFSLRSYAQLIPVARWASLALRCVIMALFIAALSQPAWEERPTRDHVVFVLDVSRSVSRDNIDAAMTDIDKLAKESVAKGSLISLIAFGRGPDPLIRAAPRWNGWPDDVRQKLLHESSLPELYAKRTDSISAQSAGDDAKALAELQARIAAVERFRDNVAGERTDFEQALRLALNCGATAERRTVYVFTDGQFNHGRWHDAWVAGTAPAAREDSCRVHVVKLDKPQPPEVALADIALPASVRVNQGFSAGIRITSTLDTPAKLIVYKDGVNVHEADIGLKAGDNSLTVPGMHFSDKGFHTVEAAVRAPSDTQVKNNANRAMVVVPGEARVLYVDADEDQMSYLKSALELEGMQVEARPATGIPNTLAELLSFDAFILCNVPADKLSFRQMQMVRTYVQDFGGGFIMLGGDESFGLGGYYGTPIEDILPVRMPIQKDMNRPALAIMLVIDKSGSMSGVKIELAKRAAMATSEAINPRDMIGLIGFDGEARVLLELTPAADRETVGSAVAGLDAGGGTFLYPALEDAHDRLASSNAKRKHVIVLSDGQTQGFGYQERVQQMASDGITLSAIGIGEGADMKLLEAIAAAGGGRAYFTNDFFSIPQIFTREAMRASNSMLVERLVEPAVVGQDVCLKDIDTAELPLLAGYVATTPRASATTILASDSGDPLLAKWRFGLGRTVAFTSDAKPRWAEDWIQWPNFAKFWSQLVRSVTGEELSRTISVECVHALDGDGLRLSADVRDIAGNYVADASVELSSLNDQGKPIPVQVRHSGPGLYDAVLKEPPFGKDQQFVWRIKAGEREQPPSSYGFVQSFSPEFQTLGPAAEVFDRMAADRHGEVMSVGNTRLALSASAPPIWNPLWPWLLLVGLLLAPVDILVRRLG